MKCRRTRHWKNGEICQYYLAKVLNQQLISSYLLTFFSNFFSLRRSWKLLIDLLIMFSEKAKKPNNIPNKKKKIITRNILVSMLYDKGLRWIVIISRLLTMKITKDTKTKEANIVFMMRIIDFIRFSILDCFLDIYLQ